MNTQAKLLHSVHKIGQSPKKVKLFGTLPKAFGIGLAVLTFAVKNKYKTQKSRKADLTLETIAKWIILLIGMIVILAGLGYYVFPKITQSIPKLFG